MNCILLLPLLLLLLLTYSPLLVLGNAHIAVGAGMEVEKEELEDGWVAESTAAEVWEHPWLEQIARQEEVALACANLREQQRLRALERHLADGEVNSEVDEQDQDQDQDDGYEEGMQQQGPTVHLNLSSLEHVLVDHRHRLLYCYVPKVACTNWKRVFMVLTGVSNASNPLDIPASVAHDERSTLRLSQLPPLEAHRCLDTYTTFLAVRHPFERLLSAYRNKFLGNSTSSRYFQERYGRQIVRRYRGGGRTNATAPRQQQQQKQVVEGSDVTFGEFARYLIDGGWSSNEHWAPVHRLCRPCRVPYSFVGRYERMAEDAGALLRLVGAPPLPLPLTRSASTHRRLRHYFQQLPVHQIHALHRIYRPDFALFAYHLEDMLGFDLP